jgi:hypothetical protein
LIRVTILQSRPKPSNRGWPEQYTSSQVTCLAVCDCRLVTCSRAVNILPTTTKINLF